VETSLLTGPDDYRKVMKKLQSQRKVSSNSCQQKRSHLKEELALRASDFPAINFLHVADGVSKTRSNFRALWVSHPRGMFLAVSVIV